METASANFVLGTCLGLAACAADSERGQVASHGGGGAVWPSEGPPEDVVLLSVLSGADGQYVVSRSVLATDVDEYPRGDPFLLGASRTDESSRAFAQWDVLTLAGAAGGFASLHLGGDGLVPGPVEAPSTWTWFGLGNVDDDGVADLLFHPRQDGNESHSVWVRPGDGEWFGEPERFSLGLTIERMTSADVDGDGFEDLVFVGRIPLTWDVELRVRYGPRFDRYAAQPLPAGDLPFYKQILVADVDGDPASDFIISEEHDGDSDDPGTDIITVLNRSGELQEALSLSVCDEGFLRLGAGDLDGDTHTDIMTACFDQALLLRGKGDGTFAIGESGIGAARPRYIGPDVVDLDLDGIPDVVMYAFDELVLYRNLGGAVFEHLQTVPIRGQIHQQAAAMTVDANHDGRPDVVILYSEEREAEDR